jgi:hypothetical protein
MKRDHPTVQWLLESGDPSIRYFTLTDLLGKTHRSPEVRAARDQIVNGPRVRTLLSDQKRDGGFGVHPYQKWTGAHWRLTGTPR